MCERLINNMDDIYYNGIELSKYEIHEYLYHNIDYPNNIKGILYEYRDVISDMYYRYLRRLWNKNIKNEFLFQNVFLY